LWANDCRTSCLAPIEASPRRIALILLLALGFSGPAAAAQEPPAPASRPELTIERLHRPPTLDDFLDMEPPADLAGELTRVQGFTQRDPEDGQPASQETDVYLGYDDDYVYVIFVAFDAEPDRMRAHIARRERVFGDETVEVQFDTFNDERRAYSFLTNPYGVQWDAIWTEGSGFDTSWDTVWQSRGQLTDRGYVVWMAIPFKSMRFPPDDDQTWGVVFVRDIPRNNEVSFWPRVTNRIEGRMNQAAILHGLEGISPGRNAQLIPYVTARRFRAERETGEFERESFDPDAGVDAKFVFRDSLTLDLTVNPDFSQVESDQPQVTVNERFEVFFPERRPFFLENADFFRTPLNLLFTRRIDEPRGGVRLTGKTGKYSLGALVIDDETPGNEVPSGSPLDGDEALFGVFRLSRDISQQSQIGVIYTDREFGGNRNRVGGFDGRVKLDDNWITRFHAVYATTRRENDDGTNPVDLRDPAYSVELNREGRSFTTHIHYVDIGEDFRTETGFVPRTDIRDAHVRTAYTFRPEGRRLVSWGPSLFVQHVSDHDSTRLDWRVNPQLQWQFRRQTNLAVFVGTGRDRLRPEDLPAPANPTDPRPVLDFPVTNHGVSFNTRFLQSVQGNVVYSFGEAINFVPPSGEDPAAADRTSLELGLDLRPSTRLRVENRLLFTRLDDRATGDRVFINQILRSRWTFQLDRRLSLRAIFQYNSTRPNAARTRLNELETDDDFTNDSRELFMKFSYLVRF
jgi:hypothetical protein